VIEPGATWTSEAATARFGAFDDAWLEREYSPSSAINGNYQPYLAAYAQRSAAVREALLSTSMLGVRYGKNVRNIIDVFPAPSSNGSRAPTVVFFHGGYWQESSLRDVSFPAAALNAAGLTYISVEYTLAPKATLSAIVEEARQAVRFIVENAARFSVDPNKLVLGGHSAGAHLATFAAEGLRGLSAQPSLLLVSGIFELLPLVRTSINAELGLDEQTAGDLSPMRGFVGEVKEKVPSAVVAWGEHDTSEFAWQSQHFANQLAQSPTTSSVNSFVIAQRNHFDVIFDLADRSSMLFLACRELLT
jgi:arylformamidase